ncbi:MAG TPA: hypothetical protein GX706_02805 [Candidatus Moranbacteria bacterium]|nr:hypothetical protein [Candidatus Moranbacteria bacterium]
MDKKIFFIIPFFIVLAGLLFWAYTIKKSRELPIDSEQQQQISIEQQERLINPSESVYDSTTENSEEGEDIVRKTNYNIKKEDCENECANFKMEEALRHCQEVCGLIPVAKVEGEDACSEKEGVAKDYCLRDKAVTAKDFKGCDLIVDKNIHQQCKNRVLEDIMDESSMEW